MNLRVPANSRHLHDLGATLQALPLGLLAIPDGTFGNGLMVYLPLRCQHLVPLTQGPTRDDAMGNERIGGNKCLNGRLRRKDAHGATCRFASEGTHHQECPIGIELFPKCPVCVDMQGDLKHEIRGRFVEKYVFHSERIARHRSRRSYNAIIRPVAYFEPEERDLHGLSWRLLGIFGESLAILLTLRSALIECRIIGASDTFGAVARKNSFGHLGA